jgi:hypothetical protein
VEGSIEGEPQQESQRILDGIDVANGPTRSVHQRETVVRAPDRARDQKGTVMLHAHIA